MTHSSAGRDHEAGQGRSSDAFARSGPEQGGRGRGWGWFTKVKQAADQDGRPADGRDDPPQPPAATRPAGPEARDREPRPAPGRDGGHESLFGAPPARDEPRPSAAGHGGVTRHDTSGEDLWGRPPGHPRHDDAPRYADRPAPGGYDPTDRYDSTDRYDPAGRYDPADRYGRPVPPAGHGPAARPGAPGADQGGSSSLFDRGLRPLPPRAAGPGGDGSWFAAPAPEPAPAPAAPAPVPAVPSYGREPVPHTPPAVEPETTGTAAFGPDDNASPDAVLIRRTMRIIEPVADKTTSYFYALLFLQHPQLRELFPAAMDTQRDRLFRALLTAAKHVDDAETLTAYLANLGRGHRKYGTRPEHYPAVGECLIGALTRYASDIWNDEVEAAWVRAYTAISQIMIDAAAEDETVAPAWWQAEIVGHERRTHDIAVITVRPDQPYPFLAGQYASLEVPWWPRVWRHYSFASAPRPDGLLSFHVKAVPAGWVSSAIVNRARLGDVVRIGPPAGTMTVNHASGDGLLCLGGGTGIAPIKALVEDVAASGRRRPVDVFYAARSGHDLYDLDTMLEMEQRHPWLSVQPVVSHTIAPEQGLVAGHLPDIVTSMGPWPAYDAYLSGPPGMIRSSVHALLGIGMPDYRIRHDSLEELVSARD